MADKIRIDWKTLVLILGVIVALLITATMLIEPEAVASGPQAHNPIAYDLVYYQETVKEIVKTIPVLIHRIF